MQPTLKCFERQEMALDFLQDNVTNEILYGGGARGGKSYIGCSWIVMSCFSMPSSTWLIAREELTKLRDTTLETFKQVLRSFEMEDGVHYRFNASTLTYEFPVQGEISRVVFREVKYIPSDPEFDRLGSYDLTGYFLDEAQQIHSKAINVLRGRTSNIQKTKPDGTLWWKTIPKALYTCNPAKNWIYQDFVYPAKIGTLPHDRAFVKSLATDNPFVSQEYIDNLKKSDKVTVERLLYGNFDYDDDMRALLTNDDIESIFNSNIAERGKKYLTIDPAFMGKDEAIFMVWDGWVVDKCYAYEKLDHENAEQVVDFIMLTDNVSKSNVVCDATGEGAYLPKFIRGIHGFIGAASPKENTNARYEELNKPQFRNLRSQCIFETAMKIKRREVSFQCPDPFMRDKLREELAQWKVESIDDDRKIQIIGKDEIRENIGRSTDYSDALMERIWFDLDKHYHPVSKTVAEAQKKAVERSQNIAPDSLDRFKI